jgi:hypothetical protein
LAKIAKKIFVLSDGEIIKQNHDYWTF